jgi:hypothetical protein
LPRFPARPRCSVSQENMTIVQDPHDSCVTIGSCSCSGTGTREIRKLVGIGARWTKFEPGIHHAWGLRPATPGARRSVCTMGPTWRWRHREAVDDERSPLAVQHRRAGRNGGLGARVSSSGTGQRFRPRLAFLFFFFFLNSFSFVISMLFSNSKFSNSDFKYKFKCTF